MNITLRCRGSKREQARPPICAAGRRAHRRAGCRGDQSNAALNARVRPNRQHSYRCRGSCSCRRLPSRRAPPRRATSASFSVSWASWASTTSPSNAPSSLSRVDAVERKPCAQWSPPGQYRSLCPRRRVRCVVGHWHAIVIGRPADRGSSSLDQRFRRRSRAKRNRVDPRSRPARGKCLARHKILPRPRDIMLGRSRREFESKPSSIPVGAIGEPGTAWARLLPWSLLFYFCQLLPRASPCWYFCWYRQPLTMKTNSKSNGYRIGLLPARGTTLFLSAKGHDSRCTAAPGGKAEVTRTPSNRRE